VRQIYGKLLLLCFTLALSVSVGAGAQERPAPEFDAGTFPVLEEILLSPDFGGEKQGWGIRFKPQGQDNPEPDLIRIPWAAEITRAFAWGLRFLLVSGILVLGGFLFFRFRRQSWGKMPRAAPSRFSLPGEEKASPESLLEKARLLYGEGKIREAWAYCFSGAAAAFAQYQGLFFPPDATEYDCLALAPAAPGFTALVSAWVNFAYGGKIPPEEAFARALDFCRSLRTPPADPAAPGKTHE
jgi:hypothetical protein